LIAVLTTAGVIQRDLVLTARNTTVIPRDRVAGAEAQSGRRVVLLPGITAITRVIETAGRAAHANEGEQQRCG
jgi:hypothetical protein